MSIAQTLILALNSIVVVLVAAVLGSIRSLDKRIFDIHRRLSFIEGQLSQQSGRRSTDRRVEAEYPWDGGDEEPE